MKHYIIALCAMALLVAGCAEHRGGSSTSTTTTTGAESGSWESSPSTSGEFHSPTNGINTSTNEQYNQKAPPGTDTGTGSTLNTRTGTGVGASSL